MMLRLVLCAFAAEAQSQTADCAPLSDFVAVQETSGLGLGPASCSGSLALGGGQSFDCHWSFEFRSAEAAEAFEDLARLLRACADDPAIREGARVNHPDSFDQITAQLDGRAVSLSIKDKGGLGQTVVFLRVAGGPPDQGVHH